MRPPHPLSPCCPPLPWGRLHKQQQQQQHRNEGAEAPRSEAATSNPPRLPSRARPCPTGGVLRLPSRLSPARLPGAQARLSSPLRPRHGAGRRYRPRSVTPTQPPAPGAEPGERQDRPRHGPCAPRGCPLVADPPQQTLLPPRQPHLLTASSPSAATRVMKPSGGMDPSTQHRAQPRDWGRPRPASHPGARGWGHGERSKPPAPNGGTEGMGLPGWGGAGTQDLSWQPRRGIHPPQGDEQSRRSPSGAFIGAQLPWARLRFPRAAGLGLTWKKRAELQHFGSFPK